MTQDPFDYVRRCIGDLKRAMAANRTNEAQMLGVNVIASMNALSETGALDDDAQSQLRAELMSVMGSGGTAVPHEDTGEAQSHVSAFSMPLTTHVMQGVPADADPPAAGIRLRSILTEGGAVEHANGSVVDLPVVHLYDDHVDLPVRIEPATPWPDPTMSFFSPDYRERLQTWHEEGVDPEEIAERMRDAMAEFNTPERRAEMHDAARRRFDLVMIDASVIDDLGTTYTVARSGGGGSLQRQDVSLHATPTPPPDATELTITLLDRSGTEIATHVLDLTSPPRSTSS